MEGENTEGKMGKWGGGCTVVRMILMWYSPTTQSYPRTAGSAGNSSDLCATAHFCAVWYYVLTVGVWAGRTLH